MSSALYTAHNRPLVDTWYKFIFNDEAHDMPRIFCSYIFYPSSWTAVMRTLLGAAYILFIDEKTLKTYYGTFGTKMENFFTIRKFSPKRKTFTTKNFFSRLHITYVHEFSTSQSVSRAKSCYEMTLLQLSR